MGRGTIKLSKSYYFGDGIEVYVWSFRQADCSTDHCIVDAEVWEILLVSKQEV